MLLEGVEVRVSVLINVSGAQVCASQTIRYYESTNAFRFTQLPFSCSGLFRMALMTVVAS